MATLLALAVANFELNWVFLGTGALLLFIVAFLSPNAALYILVFSMLLSPEIIVGQIAGQGTYGRGLTLRLEDFLIVLIALAWLAHMAVYKDTPVLRSTPLNAPIIGYLAVCAVATGFGVMAGRVVPATGFLFVFKYFEFAVIFFLVVDLVRDREMIKRLLVAALVTATIIAVIAILQIPSGLRVTAPFEGDSGEPNTLGGYLVLMLAVTLGLLAGTKKLSQRILLGILALMLLTPIAYTLSRTSWLALAAMLFTIILYSRHKVLFLSLAAGAMLILLIAPPEEILDRVRFTVSAPVHTGSIELFGIVIEPSAAARLTAWINLVSDIAVHPFLGHGVTGYHFLDSQYPRTILETGLLGLAMLFWIIWRVYLLAKEVYSRDQGPLGSALGLGLLAGLGGIVVHCIGANTFIIVRIMEPFWLLVGLAVVLSTELPEPGEETAQDHLEAGGVRSRVLTGPNHIAPV